jgi:hypothetical protein
VGCLAKSHERRRGVEPVLSAGEAGSGRSGTSWSSSLDSRRQILNTGSVKRFGRVTTLGFGGPVTKRSGRYSKFTERHRRELQACWQPW